MHNDDHPPLLARRLRDSMGFGRGIDDDLLERLLAPSDITEPPTDPGLDVDPTEERVVAAHARTGRWRRSRGATNDFVQIGGDDGHAWWADREGLDNLVNPKKRGAAERARRTAEAAFAPKGTRVRPDPARAPAAGSHSSSRWSPDDIYSWTPIGDAPPDCDSPPEPNEPEGSLTPWQVLGLSADASWREVTRRHRQLAFEHHPDRHCGSDTDRRDLADSLMPDINAAFSELRRIYQLTDGI